VYVLDPVSQDFQVLYNFASYTPPCNADNAPLQSLMLASNGILYGTTEFGGAHGGGLIFKVTPPTTLPAAGDATHGEVTILHDFGPCSAHASPRFSNADGAYPLGTLTEGADGLLYGTTYYGGANGVGTIFRIAKDGSGFESLYSFVPGHDAAGTGAYPATGLVRLPDDSLVGTTFLGGLGYGVVYRVTGPPTVSVMPAPVTAIRTGRGPLSRTVRAVVANGQAPYSYAWSVDEPDVGLRSPAAQSTEVFTSLAACDTAEGTLSVTVTDALGRSASATTAYTFEATRPNGGVCD